MIPISHSKAPVTTRDTTANYPIRNRRGIGDSGGAIRVTVTTPEPDPELGVTVIEPPSPRSTPSLDVVHVTRAARRR
jgi:hypothetical protein